MVQEFRTLAQTMLEAVVIKPPNEYAGRKFNSATKRKQMKDWTRMRCIIKLIDIHRFIW